MADHRKVARQAPVAIDPRFNADPPVSSIAGARGGVARTWPNVRADHWFGWTAQRGGVTRIAEHARGQTWLGRRFAGLPFMSSAVTPSACITMRTSGSSSRASILQGGIALTALAAHMVISFALYCPLPGKLRRGSAATAGIIKDLGATIANARTAHLYGRADQCRGRWGEPAAVS